MKLAKIHSRTDYVEEVYRILLEAISDGSLAPGERITQEELAAQFEVSRSPVLQALRLLKKDGLLQDAPGRGLVVAPLDPSHIGHLYQVRGALDGLAARLAAQQRAMIPMSLINAGRKAASGQSVRAMVEADMALHRAIYEASGNPLLVETAMLHWVHFRRVMGAVLQRSRGRDDLWDEHAAILEAIRAGDADRAEALSIAHTARARENLVESLARALGQPAAAPSRLPRRTASA